jgi:hypothetical protein
LRGVSKDGRERRRLWPILRGSPLRGERLRMTGDFFRSSTLNFCIPYPRPRSFPYPARVLSVEERFLEAILQRRERKLAGPGRPGPADRLVAKVERREALRPTSLGARGWRYQLCGAKRLLRLRGAPPAHPGASRRSIPSRGSRGTGKTRTHCAARMRRFGCLKIESPTRVPGAMQRSSRCFAEPGPYQMPLSVTAPALQRTAPRRATRCAASGARTLRRPALQHRVSLEQEFLRALAGIDFGGEDIALGVERQVVNPVEVAGHTAVAAEAADGFTIFP